MQTLCRSSLVRWRGFTLVELIIAIAVVSILTAVALPTFQSAMRKSRRADGMTALAQLVQAQERYRANNSTYFDATNGLSGLLPGNTTGNSEAGHYALSISIDSTTAASTYTAKARARSVSPQYDDAPCREFRVTVTGGNISYASSDKDDKVNAVASDPCWVK